MSDIVIVILVYTALIVWKKRRTEALWVGVVALLLAGLRHIERLEKKLESTQ